MAEQVKGMRVLVVHGDSDWVVPVELVSCIVYQLNSNSVYYIHAVAVE